MWDDGNADRMMNRVVVKESASLGTLARSLGRLKRSLSNAADRLRGK